MLATIRRELNALWHDPWLLALVSYIPLLCALSLWWLFSAGIPRQLPVAVVDFDHSHISRQLTRHIDASASTQTIQFADHASAEAAMSNTQVFAMVTLPQDLSKDLKQGHTPTIDIRYNGEFLLVGKLVSSSISHSLADALLELARLKQLAAGIPVPQANINSSPITTQITALFNQNNNYVGFLIPPIFVALLQIMAMLIFANCLNREMAQSGYQQWLNSHLLRNVLAKVIVYTPLVLLQGCFMLTWLYLYQGVPYAAVSGYWYWRKW